MGVSNVHLQRSVPNACITATPCSLLRGWWELVVHTMNYLWCDPKGQELLPKNCSAHKRAQWLGTGRAGGLGVAPLWEK